MIPCRLCILHFLPVIRRDGAMDIGSVFSLLGSQQSSVVHTEKKKQAALALKTEAQGDRVTISEEARSLLARATKYSRH